MAHSTMRAVAYMIENAPAIFKVPEPLMRDITAYWRNMEEVTTDVSSECTPCQNTHRYKVHLNILSFPPGGLHDSTSGRPIFGGTAYNF